MPSKAPAIAAVRRISPNAAPPAGKNWPLIIPKRAEAARPGSRVAAEVEEVEGAPKPPAGVAVVALRPGLPVAEAVVVVADTREGAAEVSPSF